MSDANFSEIPSHEVLPDRLNAEPPVFKGCSISELSVLSGIALVFWLPTCLLVATIFGAFTMGFGVAGIASVVTVVLGTSFYRKLRARKPDGYYPLLIRIWLSERGVLKTPIVRRTGDWSIGRQ